jgi:two-component system, sensor histidine kinase
MASASSAPRPLLVLVVDDNEINRLILSRAVEAFGASVRTAANGLEALDKIREEPFNLVFMDIAMPVLDGLEATKQARARGDDVPVVAVTAHYSHGDEPELRAAGFNGLIPKPFQITAVFEHLASVA